MQDVTSNNGRNEPYSPDGMTPEDAIRKALSSTPLPKKAALSIGDRVQGSDGRTGKIGVMSGNQLTAYVQLDEFTAGVHYTLYQVSDLTKLDDRKTSPAT